MVVRSEATAYGGPVLPAGYQFLFMADSVEKLLSQFSGADQPVGKRRQQDPVAGRQLVRLFRHDSG
jgi:hypothetical protein